MDGNLPAQAPEAKDDIYLHYNFDELQAKQGTFYSLLLTGGSVISDSVSSEIEDGTLTAREGVLTEAELAQLKILYQQAADLDTLQQAGISQIQPYLEQIASAGTVAELNQVLASEDFPFCPFLYLCVNAYDMSGVNNVFVYPEFLFVDDMDGAYLYQEEDDEFVQAANMQMMSQTMLSASDGRGRHFIRELSESQGLCGRQDQCQDRTAGTGQKCMGVFPAVNGQLLL